MQILARLRTSWSVNTLRKEAFHAVLESLETRSLLSTGGTLSAATVSVASPGSAPQVGPAASSGGNFKFAVVGDSHVGSGEQANARFKAVAENILSENLSLVLFVGDETNKGYAEQFKKSGRETGITLGRRRTATTRDLRRRPCSSSWATMIWTTAKALEDAKKAS